MHTEKINQNETDVIAGFWSGHSTINFAVGCTSALISHHTKSPSAAYGSRVKKVLIICILNEFYIEINNDSVFDVFYNDDDNFFFTLFFHIYFGFFYL